MKYNSTFGGGTLGIWAVPDEKEASSSCIMKRFIIVVLKEEKGQTVLAILLCWL